MTTDILSLLLAGNLVDTERQMLTKIFDINPLGLHLLVPVRDPDDRVVAFRFINLHHGRSFVVNEQDDTALLTDNSANQNAFQQLLEVYTTGKQLDAVHELTLNGETRWFDVRFRKFADGVLFLYEEVTRYKDSKPADKATAHDELETARRELTILHAELKAFNSIAANEYKETLRRLYTSMEYIISNDAQNMSHEGRANVRRAQAAIQRMKLLTEDILAYSGINSIETEKSMVDLYAVTVEVKKELLKKMDEDKIEVDCKDMPEIKGFPVLISLLFHHLLDHAIKSMKKDSPLTIHISCEQRYGHEMDRPQAIPSMKYSVVEITDNGSGFEPHQSESMFNIFDRSYESNRRGSGIGLAIAKKIMDMHGGFIYARGEPGKGSSFYCCFPSVS
jgi:signal transduction histidine kinase